MAAVFAVSMLALVPGASCAMGLGKPSTRAVLGEPLRLAVPLRLEPGEQVANDCVSAEVYFGDDKLAASTVSAQVLPVSASAAEAVRSGARTLLVRTTALINEPVVTVYLSAGCQARVTRKFIALADPPSDAPPPAPLTEPELPSAIAEASEEGHPVAAAASVVSRKASRAAPSRTASVRPSRARDGERRQASGKQVAKLAKAAAPSATVTPSVSRLHVDPVEADALVSPELRPSVGMDAAQAAGAQGDGPELQARRDVAAAMWRALNTTPEQQLREQQRLQELEKRLAKLHSEGEQTRQSVSALQGKMLELESDRSSLWAYALGGLALAAMGVAMYFYSQVRRQERQGAEWWPPHSGAAPLSVPREGEPDTASPPDVQDTTTAYVHAPPLQPVQKAQATVQPSSLAPAGLTAQQAADPLPNVSLSDWGVAPPSFAPPHEQEAIEHLRAVSVEELIDLEQQAEFFVVLGQDEAAIGLLEAHVQGSDGTIPLPFLKLLELYQRLGRRADYERVQAAFNAHFNAHAPVWEADLQQGQSLADYPGVIERLQALWSAPARAMDVLEKSLIRPEAGAETFELPAYRELLFLYAIARDLADKPEASIDAPTTAVTPLTATRPFIADPDARPTLDVDLCLDELTPSTAGGPGDTASSRPFTSTGLPGSETFAKAGSHAPEADYRP